MAYAGTSYAAPHVAGVAALIWSHAAARINATDIRTALIASAKDLGDEGYDTSYGNGLLQAQASLKYLADRNLTMTA